MPAKTQTAKNYPKTFTYEVAVVGLGFRLKRDVRRALADSLRRPMNGVVLQREQENRFDINAIAVYHPNHGALAGKQLGYLRADTAAILAPLMDEYAATGAGAPADRTGLQFKSAKLLSLDAEDDHKTGMLEVIFKDWR